MVFEHLRRRMSAAPVHYLLIVFAAALALASTIQGAHNALSFDRSQDMQWSGVRLLLQHIDPWAEYLRRDPNHQFALEQYPNYLPILYLITFPIGFLTLDHAKLAWLLCNLVFAVASSAMIARFYGLRRELSFLLLCAFLIATPTRNTFGNGQTSLLILWLWCLSLLAQELTQPRAAVAGVSYLNSTLRRPPSSISGFAEVSAPS